MGNFRNPSKNFWTEIYFQLFLLLLEAGKKFKIFLFFKNKKFPASHNRKNFRDEKFIKGSPFKFFEVKKIPYCGKQEKKFFEKSKKFIIFELKIEPKIILFWFILRGLFWENRMGRSSNFLFPKWEKYQISLFSEAVLGEIA